MTRKTITIVLALALLGLIGYVVSKSFGVYRVPERAEDRQVREGWKTYAFAGRPFAFDYPADWSVDEAEPGVAIVAPNREAEDVITVNVAGELPYQRAVDEIVSQLATSTVRTVVVGRLTGVRFTGRLRLDLEEGSGRNVIFTMLDYSGRLVSVDIVLPKSGGASLVEVYEKIASSFRVVENPI